MNRSSLNLAALSICILGFLGWVFLLTCKYYAFGYYDWDLAFFNQAAWNLWHGSDYVSLFGIRFFGNHSNLIVYLCLPIYVLCSHPLTLVFLKVLSVILSGYLLYLLGKKEIGPILAIFFMTLYFLYPPNIFGLVYEFDFESLSPFFLTALFYLWEKKHWGFFIGTACLTILIKENMPLVVMAFGIYGLLARRGERLRWGLLPLVLGALSFYLLVYKFIPHFAGQTTHPYIWIYQRFGQTPSQVMSTVLLKPGESIRYLLSPVNLKLLFDLFSPLLYLSFLRPQILFFISPILLQHFLSSAPQHHTIFFQYGMSLAPFIFIAALKTLGWLKEKIRPSFFYFTLTVMLVLTFLNLNGHKNTILGRLLGNQDPLNGFRWAMVRSVPKEASVISSFYFLAELSGRKDLYAFYKVHNDRFQNNPHPFLPPEAVSYALINFKDIWLVNDFNDAPQETVARIQEFFSSSEWAVQNAAEHIVLFKKGEGLKLVEIFPPDDLGLSSPIITVDKKFSLIGFEAAQNSLKPQSLLPLTFTWQSQEDIKEHYERVLFFKKNGKLYRDGRHEIGYLIYPTFVWKKGETIKERFWLYIPDLSEGLYTLEIGFVDCSHNRMGTFSDMGRISPEGTYPLTDLWIEEK